MTHEYPPNRPLDSVSISRVSALRDYGLTQRQREFLVTVMVHSGCFLERQYCEFTCASPKLRPLRGMLADARIGRNRGVSALSPH